MKCFRCLVIAVFLLVNKTGYSAAYDERDYTHYTRKDWTRYLLFLQGDGHTPKINLCMIYHLQNLSDKALTLFEMNEESTEAVEDEMVDTIKYALEEYDLSYLEDMKRIWVKHAQKYSATSKKKKKKSQLLPEDIQNTRVQEGQLASMRSMGFTKLVVLKQKFLQLK